MANGDIRSGTEIPIEEKENTRTTWTGELIGAFGDMIQISAHLLTAS